MELDNHAVDSGPASGNADGTVTTHTPPPSSGLSLKDSLAKAASNIRERSPETDPARSENGATNNTAFEPKGKTKADSLPGQAGSQEEVVAPSILEAPKHWPQKRRDAFGRFTANQDAQQEWLDHTKELEGEFTRKAQEHAEHRKFADSVRELFAPEQRALLQQHGADEVAAIKWWSQLDSLSRRDPAGYAKWFMQQAGLTPQQLFPELGSGTPAAQPEGSEWQDPDFIKLREEFVSLKKERDQDRAYTRQLEQEVLAWKQGQKQDHDRAIMSTIQQFAESKDDAGAALHPHFAEVEDTMAWIVANDPEIKAMPPSLEKLKAAYDKAVWANPATRQALIEAQTSAAQAEAAKRHAADKARSAQTLKPKVGSVAGAAKVPPADLKGLIRDAASRARG